MIAVPLTEAAPRGPSLLERVRIFFAAAVIAAGLYFAARWTGLSAGWERPAVLLAGGASHVLGVLAAAVILLVGVVVSRVITGRQELSTLLCSAGLGLAIWAALCGGGMDEWLMLHRLRPADMSVAPTVALLADYAALAVVLAAAFALFTRAGERDSIANRLRAAVGLDAPAAEFGRAVRALVVCVAVATVLMMLLSGPRAGHTLRGQVFFSVMLSLIGGVYVAHAMTGVDRFSCYWPAPILVGVIGLVVAALRPGLPPPYDHINNLPAWGPARPLPTEMVGIGLASVHWIVRNLARHAHSS